ncbi:MAG TPA: polysaccharide deacetylase family protein [Burkholderiales bacterium]|nr:polysaccharide deacetylase family protein [Burkholderiales bacterium]
MGAIELAIKVDVDTDRGTRVGVPALVDLFETFGVRTTFLFSLGPDNTGRAIRRILRPGFFGKVTRTNVVGTYGVRTLLNGALWPGPHIGRRNAAIMRDVRDRGHEIGIHCYDHVRWQDGLARMTRAQVFAEFGKARAEFERIFAVAAHTAGAAGWQANALSFEAYDEADLVYGSDVRGTFPFFPRLGDTVYRTLQIPTTLPTMDELLGRPGYPPERIVESYLARLRSDRANVLTVHAEIEGMRYIDTFRELLERLRAQAVRFVTMQELAHRALRRRHAVAVCEVVAGEIDGRTGTLAVQREAAVGAR